MKNDWTVRTISSTVGAIGAICLYLSCPRTMNASTTNTWGMSWIWNHQPLLVPLKKQNSSEEWLNCQNRQQHSGRHPPLLGLPQNHECQHYQQIGDVLNRGPPATARAAQDHDCQHSPHRHYPGDYPVQNHWPLPTQLQNQLLALSAWSLALQVPYQ